MATQKVTVGRIVHYKDNATYAAIVVAVGTQDRVNITVYYDDGRTIFFKDVGYADKPTDRCWSWPPIV